MVTPSPTQRTLTPADIESLTRASFGDGMRVVDCGPLSGGGFAAVWWVRLGDGRTVVLKTSPPTHVKLLRYERDLLGAEARYYRLVAERAPHLKVPRVLAHDRDPAVLDGDWLFMTMLPGQPLAHHAEAAGRMGHEAFDGDGPAHEEFGTMVAELHRITGSRFGYDGGRTSAATWPEAFAGLVDDLLADAVDWDINLPAPPDDFRAAVRRHTEVLAQVVRPALVQLDCWNGNVLAAPDDSGTLRLTGVVDGERYLWGDPLFDFVSPAIFRHIEDEPDNPFVRGYGPFVFDDSARLRLGLYRMHLYLLMNVELPSRGVTRDDNPGQYDYYAEVLSGELGRLRA
ncbi:aminoglycoside phosphotransferase family protein [Luedemannella helvata]|uniref:Aminoglycoside phosphotransferase domain-containing protein n=1 Tax=Luedemannella helvata TaxID=349315 RepID=A0ABN2K3A3_9ACTN